MVFPSPFLFLVFFVILINIPVSSSQDEFMYSTCKQRFDCGGRKNLNYPFWGGNHPHYCGRPGFELVCLENGTAEINIASQWYRLLDINQNDRMLTIARKDLWTSDCSMQYPNTSLNFSIFSYPPTDINITYFYNCPRSIPDILPCHVGTDESGYQIALTNSRDDVATYEPCDSSVVIPVLQEFVNKYGIQERSGRTGEAVELVLRNGFQVEYVADAQFCDPCERSGGRCGFSWTLFQPTCLCPDGRNQSQCPEKNHVGPMIAIGVSTGVGVILLAFVFYFIFWRRRKLLSKSSALISRDITPDSSSKPDLEKDGNSYFQTPIFTYDELEEATNKFDSSKELGDGGYGTVYHGKLKDGRVVAVKRLYENNYKRVEQFMNEIAILSRLRHKNLVSLYGCTSRHSRELLLIYEFVPNGTVADHLHGDRAKSSLLTWSIRMGIAIESADALSYLHASDTIHRDVKTNNILLDNNFHVKVADFGLSRLFPNDVTHVSTAPQGTPGYVDPEYYQCYQLNDKSDVYSFGVVLIELISAKPAVDITRHRDEINLSKMAINKIHNDALHELVDPSLRFETNYTTKRMITMVAELAFRCLQQEKDMRPSMNEVLEALKDIENEQYKAKKAAEVDFPADARLLKNIQPPLSPNSVTDKWVSNSTTPNTSA